MKSLGSFSYLEKFCRSLKLFICLFTYKVVRPAIFPVSRRYVSEKGPFCLIRLLLVLPEQEIEPELLLNGRGRICFRRAISTVCLQ